MAGRAGSDHQSFFTGSTFSSTSGCSGGDGQSDRCSLSLIKPKIQTDRDDSDVLVKRLARRSDCVMVPSPGLYRCLSSTFCPPRQSASPQSRAVTASSSWTLTPIIPPSFPKLATHTNARLLLCHTTSGFSLTSCQPRYESLSLCPPPSVSITFTLSFSL